MISTILSIYIYTLSYFKISNSTDNLSPDDIEQRKKKINKSVIEKSKRQLGE